MPQSLGVANGRWESDIYTYVNVIDCSEQCSGADVTSEAITKSRLELPSGRRGPKL